MVFLVFISSSLIMLTFDKMKNLFKNNWVLALLSGVLLAVSWPNSPFTFLIFFSFVPLFILEKRNRQNGRGYFFPQLLLAFLIWNLLTTWWIWHASPVGAILAILLNAAIMTLPWLMFSFTGKIFGDKLAYLSLIFYWLGFEYLHFNWDIAWPWLCLGNVFAGFHKWVQWYEFTGASGGSLWVLALNIFIFRAIFLQEKRFFTNAMFVFILPLVLSFLIYFNTKNKLSKLTKNIQAIEIAVIQPNIDPYTEKFNETFSPEDQVSKMLTLSSQVTTQQTRFLLWPETALTEGIVEENINDYESVKMILAWLQNYPNLKLITGASTYKFYPVTENKTATARRYNDEWNVDAFNTALILGKNGLEGVYHKNKMVPGVEKMPYPQIFGFLEKLSIDIGGTSGSLGSDNSASVFFSDTLGIAPVICYESVFGDFTSQFVRKGASILGIITNDGWWKNTPGYGQHFSYGKLRAIENRRYIARSANTGISGYIDPLGNVMQQTDWWVEDALTFSVYPLNKQTFFTRSGDFIGKIASFLGVMVFLSSLVKKKTRKGY